MPPRRSRLESALRLTVLALLVGAAVAIAAGYTGSQACGLSGLAIDECRGLVRTYATRIGVFAAVATAVMALFVRGLRQMAAQADADRRERREDALG
jgi:hypothetical protein